MTSESVHGFRDQVRRLSSEDVSRCYQCGKCTAGCPIVQEMDLSPNQVMRMVQTNCRERVLSSGTIWLCVSCETCATRCPEEIEIASVMDALRRVALEEGCSSPQGNVAAFHKAFLDSVEKHGRVNEIEMALKYKVAARQPFRDAGMAVTMLRRGKLSILGHNVRGKKQIRDIFARSRRFARETD